MRRAEPDGRRPHACRGPKAPFGHIRPARQPLVLPSDSAASPRLRRFPERQNLRDLLPKLGYRVGLLDHASRRRAEVVPNLHLGKSARYNHRDVGPDIAHQMKRFPSVHHRRFQRSARSIRRSGITHTIPLRFASLSTTRITPVESGAAVITAAFANRHLSRHAARLLPEKRGRTCLLVTRCPVYRRRDSNSGFRMELENRAGGGKGKGIRGRTAWPKVPRRQSSSGGTSRIVERPPIRRLCLRWLPGVLPGQSLASTFIEN
jgi:hypothetical protein